MNNNVTHQLIIKVRQQVAVVLPVQEIRFDTENDSFDSEQITFDKF